MGWLCLLLLHIFIISWRKFLKRDFHFIFGIQSSSIFKYINKPNSRLSPYTRVCAQHVCKKLYYIAISFLVVSTANASPLIITNDAPGIRDGQIKNH